jgi:N-acetylglucosaminyldiphosphoundecaprenol N-acetyl-beta-D-mannosaminyltransferase
MAIDFWAFRPTTAFRPAEPFALPVAARPGAFVARPGKVELGGAYVDRVNVAGAMERIERFLEDGRSHQVVTVNTDFLRLAERDASFRRVINAADLAVADGMPLVWLSKMKGEAIPERVTGVELVYESCKLAVRTGKSIFLLGAAPGVAARAAERLQALYPGIRIAGTYSPAYGPMSAGEEDRIVEMVREAAPGFLFVALGAPRQDLWLRRNLHRLGVPVCMGVGCVLDLLAGTVNRAPVWMQRAGLEWAFRLGQEPSRLWRRYIVDDLPTFARLAATAAFNAEQPALAEQPEPVAEAVPVRPAA